MMKRAEIEKAVEPTENTDSAEKHDEGAETGRAIHRKVWLALAGGIGLIFLALLPPGIYSVDGNGMLAVAESLVAHHSLNVPPDLGMAGRGGLFFGKWYPLQSLLAVPFVAAGTAAAHLLHLPPHYVAAIFSLVLPVAFTAATTALVALIALQLGSSWEGALLAAMTYAFGTVAMVYARSFYAEPLLALLTAASICLVFGGSPRQVVWAGLLCGMAVLAKPTGIVVGPVLAMYLLAPKRSPFLSLVPAAGSLLGLLLYFGYNEFRFGHALMFGQPWAFALSSVPEGIAGLLISPGRGLIWYCPALVLAIAGFRIVKKEKFANAVALVSIVVGFLVVHSLWSFWGGGWSWGPRFLLPGIPLLAALLGLFGGPLRRGVIVLTIVGFLINAPTLFAFYERYYAESSENGVSEQQMEWSMKYAPFLHGWPAAIRQVQNAREVDVRELLAQRGASPATTVSSSRALRIVALWWWVLPAARIPRTAGALFSFLLLLLGCFILWRHTRPFRAATVNGHGAEPLHLLSKLYLHK